ncbi:MAG: DUF4145 domain-containing protein [Proteobacteria bacterium]|nr:DUF4145 domain-containing protein [Pseudomonadota bacterium]
MDKILFVMCSAFEVLGMHNKVKMHCCSCEADTWQQILFEKSYQYPSDEEYEHCSKSILTECCGCEQPHYRYRSWMQKNDGTEKNMEDEWVFPPKQLRKKPTWYRDFAFYSVVSTAVEGSTEKEHVWDLLREIHVSLENNCPRLGVMGLRALLEHIMVSKIDDQMPFIKNLKEFQNQGYISKMQKEALGHVLEIGHAAIHRSYNPNQVELIAALDILENLIETIYIFVEKAKQIDRNVPKRKGT